MTATAIRTWRLEAKKRGGWLVQTFTDEGSANRKFQQYGNAKLTEYVSGVAVKTTYAGAWEGQYI